MKIKYQLIAKFTDASIYNEERVWCTFPYRPRNSEIKAWLKAIRNALEDEKRKDHDFNVELEYVYIRKIYIPW